MTESLLLQQKIKEVAIVFLKLGTISFGGPAAHIAMMDDEIVKRRKWVDRETFVDLLGASNLIPGPNSTELAIHLGYKRVGWWGLITAIICIFSTLLYLLGWKEIILLLLSGLVIMFYTNRKKLLDKRNSFSIWGPLPWFLAADSIGVGSELKSVTLSHGTLFVTMLKIGSVLYGSGYVLLAFLQSNYVEHYAVLTSQQLLDAVVVGHFTPGPVFTTATFVGYLISGHEGAVLATVGIFLPAFVFVSIISPWASKLRRNPWLSGMLDGVNAASCGLMAAVTWQLSQTAIIDLWTVLLAAVALFVLLRFQINSVWLVLSGASIGFCIKLLS